SNGTGWNRNRRSRTVAVDSLDVPGSEILLDHIPFIVLYPGQADSRIARMLIPELDQHGPGRTLLSLLAIRLDHDSRAIVFGIALVQKLARPVHLIRRLRCRVQHEG